MKKSEMNAHQLAMYNLMDELTKDIIGGFENQLEDSFENLEEYKIANDFLSMPHNEMVDYFYNEIMKDCQSGTNSNHARFAGGIFLREIIETRLEKWGY